MAVAPGTALGGLFAFEIEVAAAKVVLDHQGDGAAFDKGGEDFDGQAEVGRDAGDVSFGAGDLHEEGAAGVDGLATGRRDADTHAGGDYERIFAVLFQID